jgi:3-hydroxyisobutyrate dehydrogenase
MSSPIQDEALPKSVGFIGLGAMGKPMAINLAKALPSGSRMYAFDVVEAPVDELCATFPDMVTKCGSAREVAERAVGCLSRSSEDTALSHMLTPFRMS